MSANVSHGRGGAANINPDDTQYVDGEIVRQGPAGDQGDGAFSTGRGGAANIGAPGQQPTSGTPADVDIVPEAAKRDETGEGFHYGRGGEGNEVKPHHDKAAEQPATDKLEKRKSFFGKLKDKFGKKKEASK